MRVSVVYCPPGSLWERELDLDAGATMRTAIERSGVLAQFCELDLRDLPIGVFSRLRELDAPVHEGDRIEIYRPLLVDPKEARRHRAELRRKKKGAA